MINIYVASKCYSDFNKAVNNDDFKHAQDEPLRTGAQAVLQRRGCARGHRRAALRDGTFIF